MRREKIDRALHMPTGVLASTPQILLRLARERNSDLARENERLRRELDTARRLLDDALALAAMNPVAAPIYLGKTSAARKLAPTPAVSTNRSRGPDRGRRGPGGPVTAASARVRAMPPPSSSSAAASASASSAAVPAAACPSRELERRRLSALAARQAVAARKAELGLVAMQLQAAARGFLVRASVSRHLTETAAATALQAAVRGNAARGIAERKRLAVPRRRLVHMHR